MTEDQQSRRPEWTRSGLYPFLMDLFPGYRTICSFLDVKRLSDELDLSQEAVYRWLRKSTLKPGNARALLDLALATENVAQLAAAGRNPPEIRDFDRFVYVA